MDIRKQVGQKINTARREAGITQRELGEQLGYSPMGVSHFENGIREVKISDLKRIASFLGKELSFFLPSEITATLETTHFRSSKVGDPGAVQESLKSFDTYLDSLEANG